MDPVVASALTAAVGTVVGVVGTVAVAIVGFPSRRSANRETIAAAKATIEATHADVPRTLDTGGVQIADLYSRAIEQFGSDKLDVRIGGIYAANLPGAILPPADLTSVNLGAPGEDFRVTLRDANLSDAKLADAHLMKADLTGAILVGANLRRVDLSGAKLVGAILVDADLQDADLTRADLRGAALTRADLRGADLTGALWAEDMAAPEGWVRDAGSGRLSRSNATASSL